MNTLTIPEACSRFTEAVKRFNGLTAHFVNLVIGGRKWPRDEETITVVANLITSADEYAAAITTAPDLQSHVANETVMVAATRDAALIVMADINPDQVWFWTREWQAGERAADIQIARGEGTIYDSGEEFLAALEAEIA